MANAERSKERPLARRTRKAVFGSTPRKHERHFIGWLGEVDPDELFESGKAWGISVSEIPADAALRPDRPDTAVATVGAWPCP